MRLEVTPIDSLRFDMMEEEWEALLKETPANPLFMSWWWLNTWWKTFGNSLGGRLILLGIYRHSKLIALAPLYATHHSRYGINFTRIQFLGNHWRDPSNIRTEYVGMIARPEDAYQAAGAVFDYLRSTIPPGEIVLTNHVIDSPLTNAWLKVGAEYNAVVRIHESGITSGVLIRGCFRDYLDALGAKTRAKIFNHRKRLGDPRAVRRRPPDSPTELIDTLNAFHRYRWGKPVFAGGRRRFHELLIERAFARGHLSAEILQVESRPISVLYDFCVEKTRYGYQLGFAQNFDKRLSPASLHLGYAIESSFNTGLDCYDFLRGLGKSGSFYKGKITSPLITTVTYQIVLDKRLKYLYRFYDGIHALKTKTTHIRNMTSKRSST